MKRRQFLQAAAATAAMPLSSSASAAASRIVDTHTHFYDPSRPQGVPWPGKGTNLYRTVLPADWLALASPQGCRETVVVEASPWVEDNQWILDLAEKEKSIIGFVGHLDLGPEFAANLRRFAKNPIFRGIRWSSSLLLDASKRDDVLAGAKLLAEHGLELDLNGPASALPAVAQLASEVSDLRIVINHLGAPGDPKALRPEWKPAIKAVAQKPNVSMKVSALVEQVKGAEGSSPRDTAYYLPILDHLWEQFGPDRLIYGSNWPVSDKGGSYDVVFGLVREFFTSKGPEACEKYFWKNAQAAYRWRERS
ncbi:MAG: amidohydrolase family protein [Verrucomicrobiaceae bacterium]|nr:amidohydrolase family protein [Verrucomicrobiaceae bacterium]